MGIETTDNIDNVIIPQRFIPFDIGTKITERYLVEINSYIDKKGFNYLEIPGLMRTISQDILLKIRINISIKLYIFSYGIGVFVLEDDFHPMNEKYAVDYCEYRKKAHNHILDFTHGEVSIVLKEVIKDLRSIVIKEKNIRPSASDTWEYKGLSYVMTVSYIIKKEKNKNSYSKFSELEKKNLHIMLQPSLAHKEDTMAMAEAEDSNKDFDPYNFEVDQIKEPNNWMHTEDCAIYISWAAVVVYMQGLIDKYMEIVEYLEVDLQAMWLYTYCQYINLKNWSDKKKLSSSQLKKIKYNFQRRYNEFLSDNDSSIPVYIGEIRSEMINTSGIDREKNNYMEYIDFCIDETESRESEQQRKYSVMNEVLLFIIAFVQIAPMLYSALIGEYNNLKIWPIVVMIVLVVVAIFFIVRKG